MGPPDLSLSLRGLHARRRMGGGGVTAFPSVASIVGFGDSITAGGYSGVTSATTWLGNLAGLMGATYSNAGISGTVLQNSADSGGSARADNGRGRFVSALLGAAKKEMVAIAYGFNDARYIAAPATFNVSEYQNDYREIIAGLIIGGYARDRIVIISPWYISNAGLVTGSTGFAGQTRAGFEAFVTAARAVAQEMGVWYFDSYAWGRDNGWADVGDYIHPTAATQAAAAAAIRSGATILNAAAAPTSITVSSTASGTVDVSWPDTAGSGDYEVQYAVEGSYVFGGSVTTSALTTSITGLTVGSSLRLRVRRGSGPWAYASSAVTVSSAGGYPAGATFADAYSGRAAGTLVTSMTPALGSPAIAHYGSSWTPKIRPAGDILIGAMTSDAVADSTFGVAVVDASLPVSAGSWVELDLRVLGAGSFGLYAALGMASGANTYFMAGFNGSQMRILTRVAGSITAIATVAKTLVTGTDYMMRFEAQTGQQRLYLDGTLLTSAASADLSGMGAGAGLLMQVGTSRYSDTLGYALRGVRAGHL